MFCMCGMRVGGLALATLAWGVCTGADVLPVEIDVRARSVQPGELLRIEVTTPAPADRLESSFLERSVFFVRTRAESSGREQWSGWSMIALDQPAGPEVIEIGGRSADGRPFGGSRAITIMPRVFPEEILSVAPKYVEPPAEVRDRLARERSKLAAVYRTRGFVPPAAEAFVRPVPGQPTSVFGTRRVFNGKPRDPHSGLDLRAASGTPVHASGPGHVSLAQDLYYSGNTVIVDHGGGLFTIYAHLSELHVREGQDVGAGQRLGLSGATGRVTGPHLHWGAKIGDVPFDPTALLHDELF